MGNPVISRINRSAPALLFFVTLLLVLCTACDGNQTETPSPDRTAPVDPTATPTATVFPEPTIVPTTTAVATATPEPIVRPTATATSVPAKPTPGSSAVIAKLKTEIDADTTWQEVFDVLSGSEQSCIRSALGDDPEWALTYPVWPDGSNLEDREESILICLEPENARSLFLSLTKSLIEMHTEVSDEEIFCLQELVSDTDVADLVDAHYGSPDSGEYLASLISCVPGMLFPWKIWQ